MFSVITAFADDDSTDAGLTNTIDSLERTVAQDSSTLTATSVDEIDTYYVDSTENITVTYTTSMNMEYLTENFVSELASKLNYNYDTSSTTAWDTLQKFYTYITDDTVIYLTFKMDSDILISTVDFTNATFTSDMFTCDLTNSENYTINTENSTLTLKCTWSSTNAANAMTTNSKLDPQITLSNVTFSITDDWDGADSITIYNEGSVAGTMYYSVTMYGMTLASGNVAVDDGSATDTFVLVLNETTDTPTDDTEDTEDTEDEISGTPATEDASTVETSDSSNTMLYIAIMGIAALGLCITALRKKFEK